MHSPIVFIHIPKTAGTSFRLGANRYFGENHICCDYGPLSQETSEIVQQRMIKKTDPWHFKNAFEGKKYLFMSGHYQDLRYVRILGVEGSVVFLREPLQRILSEYKHFVRHNNYKKGFGEFYRTKQFINRQSKMMRGIPWASIGFIGITEYYDTSLNLFNDRFGVSFTRFEENLSRKTIVEDYELDPDQERELRQLNSDDISLYRQACRQFEWRVRLAKENRVFSRGMIAAFNNQRLIGWAVYDEGDDPVEVEVSVNGKSVGNTVSSEVRPQLQALGLRRGGFVGFSLEIPKLSPGDEVTAFVANTGQPLANSPWVYADS